MSAFGGFVAGAALLAACNSGSDTGKANKGLAADEFWSAKGVLPMSMYSPSGPEHAVPPGLSAVAVTPDVTFAWVDSGAVNALPEGAGTTQALMTTVAAGGTTKCDCKSGTDLSDCFPAYNEDKNVWHCNIYKGCNRCTESNSVAGGLIPSGLQYMKVDGHLAILEPIIYVDAWTGSMDECGTTDPAKSAQFDAMLTQIAAELQIPPDAIGPDGLPQPGYFIATLQWGGGDAPLAKAFGALPIALFPDIAQRYVAAGPATGDEDKVKCYCSATAKVQGTCKIKTFGFTRCSSDTCSGCAVSNNFAPIGIESPL